MYPAAGNTAGVTKTERTGHFTFSVILSRRAWEALCLGTGDGSKIEQKAGTPRSYGFALELLSLFSALLCTLLLPRCLRQIL